MITIDGPAGVGKSTVAKLLAKRLGLLYLDTGATYRALAYAAVQAQINPIEDVQHLASLAKRLPLTLRSSDDGTFRVLLNGVDVTTNIRTEEVTEAAAQVSQHPEVREAMVALQRRLAHVHSNDQVGSGRLPRTPVNVGVLLQGVVVEGRDTGSVVFPRATYKFFLDANSAIRARRRQKELSRLYGTRPPIVQIQEQLHFRDSLDRSRRVGPLITPRGATVIDTSHLTAPQVVRVMLRHITRTHCSGLRAQGSG